MTMHINGISTGPTEASTVVLLHSAGLDLTYWQPQIIALRDHYRVVAFDLPGHGRSAGTAKDLQIDTASAAVATAVRSLDCGPVHLVGLSVGGLIAQTIAIEEPRLVRTLTLIDSAARFSEHGQSAMRTRAATLRSEGMHTILDGLFGHWFLPATLQQRPELVDRATKTLLHDDVAGQAAMWEMIADFDAYERLPQVQAPALVLVGEHDSSSPVAAAQELCDQLPSAQLRIIPDAAHLSPIERPDEVTAQLNAFLAVHTDGVLT